MSSAPPPHDLSAEPVALEDLHEHPDNPRQGDVGAISESMRRFGVYQPIVAQTATSRVIAGNHRLRAARALGLATLPVIWLDVDDVTALAIMAADNRTSDLASYDAEALGVLLRELAQQDALTGTGYDGDDVDALLASLEGTPAGRDASAEVEGTQAIIIECESEAQQRELIDEFMERGLTTRAAVI